MHVNVSKASKDFWNLKHCFFILFYFISFSFTSSFLACISCSATWSKRKKVMRSDMEKKRRLNKIDFHHKVTSLLSRKFIHRTKYLSANALSERITLCCIFLWSLKNLVTKKETFFLMSLEKEKKITSSIRRQKSCNLSDRWTWTRFTKCNDVRFIFPGSILMNVLNNISID